MSSALAIYNTEMLPSILILFYTLEGLWREILYFLFHHIYVTTFKTFCSPAFEYTSNRLVNQ